MASAAGAASAQTSAPGLSVDQDAQPSQAFIQDANFLDAKNQVVQPPYLDSVAGPSVDGWATPRSPDEVRRLWDADLAAGKFAHGTAEQLLAADMALVKAGIMSPSPASSTPSRQRARAKRAAKAVHGQ